MSIVDFDTSIKDFDDLFYNLVLELRFVMCINNHVQNVFITIYNYLYRNDFFVAKSHFYAMYMANPIQPCDVFSLGEHCIQELQSLSLLLPQIDINAWSRDAIEKVLLNCSQNA